MGLHVDMKDENYPITISNGGTVVLWLKDSTGEDMWVSDSISTTDFLGDFKQVTAWFSEVLSTCGSQLLSMELGVLSISGNQALNLFLTRHINV